MGASDKDTLLGMGFDAARVEWALKATGGRGLQPAMDHILEHDGEPVPALSAVSATASAPGGSRGAPMDVDDDEDAEALRAALGNSAVGPAPAADAGAEARSIMCSECRKVFRNTDEANFHAVKSGHDQFEESTEEKKPLTEEEKQQKLADLRDKMAAKRAQKAVADAQEAKANEAIRRKGGKDLGQAAEELKLKQAQKEAEQKKREKAEDVRARAAIKAQIEADKRERAEKFAREKALRDGLPVPGPSATPAPAAAPAGGAASGTAGREFKETRLQIRMASGGQPWTTTLSSDAPLREVAEFVAAQTLAVDADTVSLAQHFPRKTFTRADLSKSLKELGLTPSAVIIASAP